MGYEPVVVIILAAVVAIVRFATKKNKDESEQWTKEQELRKLSRPDLPPAVREQPTSPAPSMRDRAPAQQPRNLEEALDLADDRPATPTMRFAALGGHDEDEERGSSALEGSEPEQADPGAERRPASTEDAKTEPTSNVLQGDEPEPVGPPQSEPLPIAGLDPEPAASPAPGGDVSTPDAKAPRAASTTSTPYVSSSPVYTPTSVYTSSYSLSGESSAQESAADEDGEDTEDVDATQGPPR